jgi:hypothetical protein
MSEFQKLFESVFPNNTDQLRASEKKQMKNRIMKRRLDQNKKL